MDVGLVALLLAILVLIAVFIGCFLKNAGQPNAETDADQYVKMLYGDADNKKNKKGGKKVKDEKKKKVDEDVKQTVVHAEKASPKVHKPKQQKYERTPTPEVIPQDPRDESSEREQAVNGDEAGDEKPHHVEKKRADSNLRNDNEKLISTLGEFAISEKVLFNVTEKIRQLDHYQQMAKSSRNDIDKLEKAARQQSEKIVSLEKKVTDDQRRIKELQTNVENEKGKHKRLDQEINEKSQILNNTIKILKEEKDALETETTTLRNAMTKVAGQCNDEKARAERFRHDLAALQTERVKLNTEIERLEAELRRNSPKIEKQQHVQAQQAIAASNQDKQHIQQLQKNLEQEKQQHDAARGELHTLQKAHSHLEHQQHNLVERIAILEADLAAAHSHNAAHPSSNEKEEKVILDLQHEVEKLGLNRNELEQRITTLTHERDRMHKAHKQGEGTIQSLKQKLADKEKEEAEAHKIQAELMNARSTIETLQSGIDALKSSADSSDNDKQQLVKQIDVLKAQVDEAEQTRNHLRAQLEEAKADATKAGGESSAADQQIIDDLKEQVAELTARIAVLNEQLNQQNVNLNVKVDELSRECMQLQHQLHEKTQEMSNLAEIKSTKVELLQSASNEAGKVDQLYADLKALEEKNKELRDKNYKALEAVAQAEKNCQQVVNENKAKYDRQIKEQQSTIDELNKKLASSSSSHTEVIKQVHFQQSTAAPTQNGLDDAELKKLKDENARLKDSIEKLKSVQVHAKSKEAGDAVAHLQQLNDRYVEALTLLREQLTTIENTSRIEIQKYEERCERLANQLQQVQLSSLNQSNADSKKSEKLHEDLSNVNEQLVQLQRDFEGERVEYSTLKDQLLVLQQALETERSTCKNLSQEAVKLRGMLKVGQDALKQEQSITANLREQLRHFQDAEHVNGYGQ